MNNQKDIEAQQEKIRVLLRKALNEDKKQVGSFTKEQNEAWQAYDDALSELSKMMNPNL